MKRSLFFMIVLVLLSCSDFEQKQQLKRVETLLNKTKVAQANFLSSFPDTLGSMRQNMMNLQLFLKTHVLLDSVDRSYAADMDAYKLARKKIKPINKQYVVLKSAFQEERTRLLQLKSDIANGFGKRQKYDQYIQTETKNVSLLIRRSNELKQEIHSLLDKYNMLHPKLSALSKKFK